MKKGEIRELILRAITSIGNDANIAKIEQHVNLERHTVSKYLKQLRDEGYVDYSSIGSAKLWHVKNVPADLVFAGIDGNGKTMHEKVLSDIILNLPVGVMIMDEHYKIFFANQILSNRYGRMEGSYFYRSVAGLPNPLKLGGLIDAVDRRMKYHDPGLAKINAL